MIRENKKELEQRKKIRDARLNNIINNGKIIGHLPSIYNNKYYLLDNIVWYYPYGSYPENEGTLEEFKNKINNNRIKIKLIIDINKL